MIKYFQNRFALTEKGAKDFVKGISYTILLNLSILLPAMFVFFFLEDYIPSLIGSGFGAKHGMYYYCAIAAVFMLLMFLAARAQYRSTYTCVYDESANRRIALAEKLRKLPLAFFAEKNLSDLTATIMDDNAQLEQTFSHSVPQLFAAIITLLLAFTGLVFYNWQLTVALFWVVPVAGLVVFLSKRMMGNVHKDFYKIKRGVTEQIQEGLDMAQEMKAYNQEDAYLESLDSNLNVFEKALLKGELLVGTFLNVSHILLKLGLATVIIWGAKMLMAGSIDILTYLVFLMISASIYNPIIEVFNNIAVLIFLDVRIDRMKEMEAMEIQQGAADFAVSEYNICFENVDFSYEEGKQVLSDVSFVAKQGEVTALVGASGGGKTTSVKLAARFWDIDKGLIKLGGKDISQVDPEVLLQYYSVVFQDVILFNSSVMENIRIGNQKATDEEVMQVAKMAQCHQFIEQLPQGYDTVIGENGHTLSGGERQRISIARALLKDAPIVLLDEATASIDVENESKIQAALSALIKNKTVLIIAHRMRTVANADKIVVLKDGKVVEQGSPKQLAENINGEYRKMINRQLGVA